MIHICHVYEDRYFANALKKILINIKFKKDDIVMLPLSEPFDFPRDKKDILFIIYSINFKYTQIRDLLIEFNRDMKFKLNRDMVLYINLTKNDVYRFLEYLEKCNAMEVLLSNFITNFEEEFKKVKEFDPKKIKKNEFLFDLLAGKQTNKRSIHGSNPARSHHPSEAERYKRFLKYIMPGLYQKPGKKV